MQNSDQLINSIIQQFDPEKKTHVKLNWALTALGIGVGFIFSFVLGPEAIVAEGALAGVAETAIQGIKKAPGLAQAIWPVGTENSQPLQELASQEEISSLEDALEGDLDGGLAQVQGVSQSDVSKFLAFVGDGDFSASEGSQKVFTAVANEHVQPLRLAFTTFLVSNALAQNGWHVLLLPGETRSCSMSRHILAAIQPHSAPHANSKYRTQASTRMQLPMAHKRAHRGHLAALPRTPIYRHATKATTPMVSAKAAIGGTAKAITAPTP